MVVSGAMRPRSLVGFVFALILLCALAALAQPKKGAGAAAKEADDKAAAVKSGEKAAAKNGEKAADKVEAAPAPEATGSDDLGEPPPKAPAGDKGGAKLSPLNPAANEFPDAGVAPPPPEFDRLLGDIAALRSRVAALTTTLFASKLRVIVETRADDARIAIDDFMKVELRVARVLEAELVPKSKKLLKLRVDAGGEHRTIVAGIAEAYQPEQLVGRTIVIVANLKPAKLMGIESNGMVLAASPEGGLPNLVSVDPSLPPGSRVR